MNKKRIVVASHNMGKVKEIQAIFSDCEVLSLKDLNYEKEVEEDGNTFQENALKKATVISKDLNMLCIADDSGICIDSLNGFPGVRTARFLPGTPRDRNLAILEKMKGVPRDQRKVTFVVCIAISDGNSHFVVEEKQEGYIATECRGSNGFGFDEIFELEDGRTVAELPFDEILSIRPRKKALESIQQYMEHF